ncbi:MAG: hypothetical protein ACLFQB_11865 [Chitinispirillaceae bacterium]
MAVRWFITLYQLCSIGFWESRDGINWIPISQNIPMGDVCQAKLLVLHNEIYLFHKGAVWKTPKSW